MKKNKNIILIIFSVAMIVNVLFCQKVFAVDEGGVWGDFLVNEETTGTYWNATLRKIGIFDTIDFSPSNATYPNLDSVGEPGDTFGIYRKKAVAPHKYAEAKFQFRLYAPDPTTRDYYFSVEKSDKIDFRFTINGKLYRRRVANPTATPPFPSSGILTCDAGASPLCSAWTNKISLAQGWHTFTASALIDRYEETPTIKLKWGANSTVSTHTVIPKEYFIWSEVSDEEIMIPETTNPEDKVNFFTSGVGSVDYLNALENPKISLNIPAGPTNSNFSYDAYVFWFDNTKTNPSPQIKVQNTSISGSPEQSLTGTRLETTNGIPLISCYAKIPTSLLGFDEVTREMNFVFKDLSSANNPYGLGIVIPYKDESPSAKNTRLYLKLLGEDPYYGTRPPVTFDLDEDIDKTNLKPVFFFGDGGTKGNLTEDPPVIEYRPNFMSVFSGAGPRPNKSDFLSNMGAVRIFPKVSSGLDINNSDTWYPNFGREGNQFDVISSSGNYLPNQDTAHNNYDNITGDGLIAPINATGKDWVSFQYYSSNFLSDGVTGSPDSTEVLAIGLLGGEKNKKVRVCPTAISPINKGDIINFKAWYWENYNGSGDYCNETTIPPVPQDVTDSSNISWESSNPAIVKTTAIKGSFEAVSDGLVQTLAKYNVSGDLLRSNDVDVKVLTPLEVCNYTLCDATTGYVCKSVTTVGDSCSTTTDTCTIPSTCEVEKWREVTP